MNDSEKQDESKGELLINLNEDYRIKVEDQNKFNESIFNDIYDTAARRVIEIVNQSEKKISDYDDYNNIIAFTGERGKGKSSSMISFMEALVNKEIYPSENNFFNSYSSLKEKKFASIGIIDPSLFRGDESLFEIILAKMFQEFQKKIKTDRKNIGDDERRKIISKFQEVFSNLQIINSDRKDLYKFESIETLSKLASSSNLRECFKELVEIYLKEFLDNKDYLIITIDDFDLNISGAYNMLEDIRQYLVQNKIILLLACKIEQLNEAIIINYRNENIQYELENKAKRYLDKLIPFNRRLNLPDVQKIKFLNIKILNNKKVIFENVNSSFNKSVVKYVFNKSEILLSSNTLDRNFIFPTTIRETLGFIKSFNQLENGKCNYDLIKQYLLEEILKKNIEVLFFQELEDVSDDLFVLLAIRKIIKLSIPLREDERTTRQRKILLPNNIDKIFKSTQPEVVSIGDLNFIIQDFEGLLNVDDYKQLEFIDYLKLYISLRFLSMSDSLTELKITKYGFINNFFDILAKEDGKKQRDFITFDTKKTLNINKITSETSKFILSQFMLYLGTGYNDYRNDIEKDIFVDNSNQGIFSPFAIFHNLKNIKDLGIIFNYSETSDFINENTNWFENSKFIKQLYSPSFSLELFDLIRNFRYKVKETLPKSYFENICFLFIYGTISSLESICDRYNLDNDLIEDFLKFPILLVFLKTFNNQSEYKHRIINSINTAYKIEDRLDINKELEEEVILRINNIFNDSIDGFRKIAENLLNNYKWYFEHDQTENSRGAKQAMNSVYKSFSKDTEPYEKLSKLRTKMDEDLQSGLTSIFNYLTSLKE